MNNLLDLTVILLQNILLFVLLQLCFEIREEYRLIYCPFFLFVVFLTCAMEILFSKYQYLMPVMILVYEIITSLFFLKGKNRDKIILIVSYHSASYGLNLLLCQMMVLINGADEHVLYSAGLASNIFAFIAKISISIFVFAMIYIWKKSQNVLSVKNRITLLSVPVVSIWLFIILINDSIAADLSGNHALLLSMKNRPVFQIFLFGGAAGIILCNLCIYNIYQKCLKYGQLREEFTILEPKAADLNQTTSNDSDLELKHDYKKQIHMISNLLIQKKYEQLKDYLQALDISVSTVGIQTYTENTFIDTILSEHRKTALEKDINFIISAGKIEEQLQDPVSICSLLGNVLDNAIEACERWKDLGNEYAYITVKLQKENNLTGYVFSVNNSSDRPVQKDGRLLTKKEDTVNHGIGMNCIKNAVKQIKGTCVYGYEKNTFSFVCKIPFCERNISYFSG